MKTVTEYAHLYLQGYNTVPVGVLDNPEFRAEVARLSGGPSKEEQIKYLKDTVVRLEQALMPLYGPRGGLPKQHRRLEWEYHKLKGQLELETA
jgi:predicted component of type VI protein secretion system